MSREVNRDTEIEFIEPLPIFIIANIGHTIQCSSVYHRQQQVMLKRNIMQ